MFGQTNATFFNKGTANRKSDEKSMSFLLDKTDLKFENNKLNFNIFESQTDKFEICNRTE